MLPDFITSCHRPKQVILFSYGTQNPWEISSWLVTLPWHCYFTMLYDDILLKLGFQNDLNEYWPWEFSFMNLKRKLWERSRLLQEWEFQTTKSLCSTTIPKLLSLSPHVSALKGGTKLGQKKLTSVCKICKSHPSPWDFCFRICKQNGGGQEWGWGQWH